MIHVAHFGFTTPSKTPIEKRIHKIHWKVGEVISEYKPDVVGIEEFFAPFKKTRAGFNTAKVIGAILVKCSQHDVPVKLFSPLINKRANVGRTRKVSKEEMQEAVRLRLNLKDVPTPNHAADALGICVCEFIGEDFLNK